VWISAFLSATVLNKDLTDFRYTAEAGGFIDGPSAGALMTAGFLASLTDVEMDPAATMTGTVNPDGTVGPVGGIPQKFRASIAAGKKRLGYPMGLRYAEDLDTGRVVDLAALARDGGAEAVEIGDIYQAYAFLTGKTLPVPRAVAVEDMGLEDEVVAKLEHYYGEWLGLLQNEWATIIDLNNANKLPRGLVSLAMAAQEEAGAAERLRRQGITTSAYHRIIAATQYAATATAVAQMTELVKVGDVGGAVRLLDEFESLATLTEVALRQAGGIEPGTMAGHLRMISSFNLAITGWGFHTFGTSQLAEARKFLRSLTGRPPEFYAEPQLIAQVVDRTVPGVLAVARGITHTKMAIESLEIEGSHVINYSCSLPNARRLATSFSSAAAANLAYFESLLVAEIARIRNSSDEEAKLLLMSREPDYLTAVMAFRLPHVPSGLPQQLKEEWGETSLPWSLGTLSGSILSYFKTSLLIAKWYSLGVQTDDYTGIPVRVQHDKAFMNMLANAERKSREHAHAARITTGSIPVQARLHYQNAKMLREGSVSEKLRALELYWEASVYSQTAVMLARN
jgi:uncharacterized protein